MRSTFREYTTISGRTILVRPNFSKRVFTIKTESGKYKTYKLSRPEFDENLFNTGNDWQNYLRTSQDIFPVK
jgi:5-methylcytosine-specific restriction endonuclease McrBC GTP-binding regulatory subunit McrB